MELVLQEEGLVRFSWRVVRRRRGGQEEGIYIQQVCSYGGVGEGRGWRRQGGGRARGGERGGEGAGGVREAGVRKRGEGEGRVREGEVRQGETLA